MPVSLRLPPLVTWTIREYPGSWFSPSNYSCPKDPVVPNLRYGTWTRRTRAPRSSHRTEVRHFPGSLGLDTHIFTPTSSSRTFRACTGRYGAEVLYLQMAQRLYVVWGSILKHDLRVVPSTLNPTFISMGLGNLPLLIKPSPQE